MMQSEAFGLVFLIFSLWCLGTWPALLRLCTFDEEKHKQQQHHGQQHGTPGGSCQTAFISARGLNEKKASYFFSTTATRRRRRHFESTLQQTTTGQCRHICHVYMDYATSYFLVSSVPLLLGMLLGETQDEPQAGEDVNCFLGAMSPLLIMVAMLGGTLLSLGNLSLQWATSIYGASLSVALAIQASMTVVLGTFLNFALEPSKTEHPLFLVTGVMVFLLAISLAAMAHILHGNIAAAEALTTLEQSLNTSQLDLSPCSSLKKQNHHHNAGKTVLVPMLYTSPSSLYISTPPSVKADERSDESSTSSSSGELSWDAYRAVEGDGGIDTPKKMSPEVSSSIEALNNKQQQKEQRQQEARTENKSRKGLYIVVAGGLAFGFFSPAFNIAVNDPFQWSSIRDEEQRAIVDGGLAVARTNIWFSLAFWIASVLGNVFLLHREQMRWNIIHTDDNDDHTLSICSIIWVYLSEESFEERQVAFMAGLVCAVGNALQFQAGKMVGYAAADLVQAYPLVSTLWDVFLFQEFGRVDLCSRLGVILLAMYTAYLAGIALLAGSSVL